MPDEAHIVVTVANDGTVRAETVGLTGPDCLDYITVLEDLLDARTVHSAYTAEYEQATASATDRPDLRDVDRA